MPEPFGWFSGSPPSTENMPRWTARRCECAGPFVLSHLHPTPVGIIQEVPVTETIHTLSLHACAEGDILPLAFLPATAEPAPFAVHGPPPSRRQPGLACGDLPL